MSRKLAGYGRFTEFGLPIKKPNKIKAKIEADIRPSFKKEPFATGGVVTLDGGTMWGGVASGSGWSGGPITTSTGTTTTSSAIWSVRSSGTGRIVGTWSASSPWTMVYDEYDPLDAKQKDMVQEAILEEVFANR